MAGAGYCEHGIALDWPCEACEFKPCVIVYDDPKRTEMLLRDCSVVWTHPGSDPNTDLGYDMETGELVAIRYYGDVSKRKGLREGSHMSAAAEIITAEIIKEQIEPRDKRIAELEARLVEVAHAYDVTFKRRVELENALLNITHRDSTSGAIRNSYAEGADLREYVPILETVHKG